MAQVPELGLDRHQLKSGGEIPPNQYQPPGVVAAVHARARARMIVFMIIVACGGRGIDGVVATAKSRCFVCVGRARARAASALDRPSAG